jgi:hypothetical protein
MMVTVLIAMTVIGLVAAFLFDQRSQSSDDIWANLSKAGVTIAVITVAGAMANIGIKALDERRARDLERRRLFHDIVDAYNAAKAARRGMSALGFKEQRDVALRADEADELRSIMAKLNETQLRFEAIKREVEQSDLFRRRNDMLQQLRIIEDYINKSVLDQWEKLGCKVWAGATPETVDGLNLRHFIVDGFQTHVSAPLKILTQIIQGELAGHRRR